MIGLPYLGAAPPRHRNRDRAPLRAAHRGAGVDVRLRPHRLRPPPHRARPGPCLRRSAAVPDLRRARGPLRLQRHRHRRQRSSSGRTRRAAARPTWRPSSRPAGGSDGRARRPAPARHPARHGYIGRHGRAGRESSCAAAWPTRRRTGCTSRSIRSRATACWRTSRSIPCGPGPGSRPTRRSGARSTSPCGRRPSRASPAGSPLGAGRPGWHTECVVMSLDLLGEGFDLHGGGQDLTFPHHENERAQAVAEGKAFARHWVHNGWVRSRAEDVEVARATSRRSPTCWPVTTPGPTGCSCCARSTARRSR